MAASLPTGRGAGPSLPESLSFCSWQVGPRGERCAHVPSHLWILEIHATGNNAKKGLEPSRTTRALCPDHAACLKPYAHGNGRSWLEAV